MADAVKRILHSVFFESSTMRSIYCLRYIPGVMPVHILKALIKDAVDEKCISSAIYANVPVGFASEGIKKRYVSFSQSLMSATISAGTLIGSLPGEVLIDCYGVRVMLFFRNVDCGFGDGIEPGGSAAFPAKTLIVLSCIFMGIYYPVL